mgnify:CR=1 FL=1
MIRLAFGTSGTTGAPKDVVHTLDAMLCNADAFNGLAGLNSSTVMYHCLPWTHMSGFLNTILSPTVAGGRVAFGPTFSAKTAGYFWEGLADYDANTVWITPTIAAALLRMNRLERDVTRTFGARLHHVFCGTAPLPRKTREQWLDTFGIPLQESYGTSEHMLVSVQGKEDASRYHDVGTLLPGIKLEIGDSNELFVNGTATGDQGEMRDGRLTITGRIKDLIIRGGFNVAPVQIEEAVRKADGVADAAVVGWPDEFWGEKIVVFAEGGEVKAIQAYCRSVLPKSHWPDFIEIVDKLPRNEMGKVRKSDLVSRIAA